MEKQPVVLKLISGGQVLKLRALDGSRLICESGNIFKSHIDHNFIESGINKTGIATPEIIVQVNEVNEDSVGMAFYMDTFSALPGTWNQKWL